MRETLSAGYRFQKAAGRVSKHREHTTALAQTGGAVAVREKTRRSTRTPGTRGTRDELLGPLENWIANMMTSEPAKKFGLAARFL